MMTACSHGCEQGNSFIYGGISGKADRRRGKERLSVWQSLFFKGCLLDEFQFSFDLQNTNRMMLLPEKEHVLFVQEPVYDGNNRDLLIYGMEQEQFKRIDHMPLNGLNITDISGNYANTLLHYKKDTGILHIVVNDDGKALYVAAQTNKKLLYRSTLPQAMRMRI